MSNLMGLKGKLSNYDSNFCYRQNYVSHADWLDSHKDELVANDDNVRKILARHQEHLVVNKPKTR